MFNKLHQLIAQKAKLLDPLPEELEICKALIQDKINQVVALQEEITLLQEFVASRRSKAAEPEAAPADQISLAPARKPLRWRRRAAARLAGSL
jgi:hypothetical protein